MHRRSRRTAAWVWGILALLSLIGAVVAGLKLLPALKVGDVDPVSAAIGAASLLVSAASLYLSVRAMRPPLPTTAEAADRLARQVTERERTARHQLLGDNDKLIDITFGFRPASTHPAIGARRSPSLSKVVDYYHRSPHRMVITGAPGAGKTVMAVELILDLLAARDTGQAVPVRISAASLDTDLEAADAVEQWLRRHLVEVYQLPQATAHALVHDRLIIPVIDGLDEMDTGEKPAYDSRASRVLRAINTYQDQYARAKGAVVLTCRTAQYQALEGLQVGAHDAARVDIAPVGHRLAQKFVEARAVDPAQWNKVLTTIRRNPDESLARSLSTPWRLTLAVTVYDERDQAGNFLRHPDELIAIAASSEELRDHLLGLLIPAAVAAAADPPPGAADAETVHRWLGVLAAYLNNNIRLDRTVGGRPLSGTDLVPHELWLLAGNRPRLLASAIVGSLCLAPAVGASVSLSFSQIGFLVLLGFYFAWATWGNVWPEPRRINLRRLRPRAGRRLIELGLSLGLLSGFTNWLDDDRGGALESLATVMALITFMYAAGVTAKLVVEGTVAATDPLYAVRIDSGALAIGGVFGLVSGVGLELMEESEGGLAAQILLGLVLGLAAGLTGGRSGGLVKLRYLALLVCTRRLSALWLPWQLGRFLDWAYKAGLLRLAGIAYQFRHRELQDYLATHPTPESPPPA